MVARSRWFLPSVFVCGLSACAATNGVAPPSPSPPSPMIVPVAAVASAPATPATPAAMSDSEPGDDDAAASTARFTVDPSLDRSLTTGISVSLTLRSGRDVVGACRVVYDLWDEIFRVDVAHRHVAAPTLDAVFRRCLTRRADGEVVVERDPATHRL